MDKAEQQEQAEADVRTSAAGAEERDQSQTEYRDLSDEAAVAAFEEQFPKFANAKPVEPLAGAAGAHEVEFLDDHSAVVTEERGQPGQLVTTVGFPMRARGQDGLLRPVDLEVVPDGDAFSPTTPAVSTELGERADDGASVGAVGVDVVGVEPAAGVASGGQVRYPNVDVDSDLVIATQPHGVETYSVLRSPDSPEVERLRLSVPADARISETSDGGAEVKVADRTVATISAPRALDAQGAEVPSKLVVDGSELVITTAHRDRDVAYPVLVDPVISYWTNDGKNSHFVGWQTTATQGGYSFPTWSTFGEGRYIDASPTIYYLNTFGQWSIDAQGESFFVQADFYNVSLDYNNPGNNYDWFDLTAGIWSNPTGRWVAVNGWSSEQTVPKSSAIADPNNPNAPDYRTGNQIRFALTATAQFGRQYWTRGYLGGAALWQEDHNVPSVTNAPAPTTVPRWSETSPSISVDGYDAGLGLRWFGVYGPGFEAVYDPGCTGDAQQACPMTKTGVRFPDDLSDSEKSEWTSTIWREGIHRLGAHVTDVVGRQSPDAYWRAGIDRDKPSIALSGSLNQGGEPLTGDSHTLKIKATDGDVASDALKRSGVKSIRVDTRQVKTAGDPSITEPTPWTNRYSASQTCAQVDGSCPMERDWEVLPGSGTYPPGEYEVRVTATDQLDHSAEKTFVMVIPPPVAAEEASADFLGLEQWWTYDSTDTGAGTQAHVNLANGNLVWHSMPVVNAGRGLSTMVNLTYNSLQREPSPLLETPLETLEPYNETGFGFSLATSSLTRLNERLNVDMAGRGRITLTDADGTRHHFAGQAGNEVFTPPPGVQLHLRRFSKAKPFSPAAIGYQELDDNDKAWAATRPDGVTYFFDRRGYQTLVQDRNKNTLSFSYEYRGPTRTVCAAAASSSIFVMPNRLCPRKLVKVTDAGLRDLKLTYEPRTLATLPAQLTVDGEVPAECKNGLTETAACASGRLKSITDHLDRVTEFTYDSTGYLQTLVQAKGALAERQFDFGYDATTHSRTALRGMTEITEPGRDGGARLKTRIAYETTELLDADLVFKRRVKSVFDRGEQGTAPSRQFAYGTPSAGRTTVTDANNKLTEYALDARGRMTSRLDPADTAGVRATTELGWDADNNLSALTRAKGTADEAVETMSYNVNGALLTRTVFPEGETHTTTLSYQGSDGALENRSPRGNDTGGMFVSDIDTIRRPNNNGVTDFNYKPDFGDVDPDRRGNVAQRTDAAGNSVRITYDVNGQILTERDEIPNPVTTYGDYDANGMPRTVVDPKGGGWRYCYDAAGRMKRASDPRSTQHDCASSGRQQFSTELTYDVMDRLKSEVVPKRSTAGEYITRSYGYDDNDNLIVRTDGENRTDTRSYTSMDELDKVSSPQAPHFQEPGSAAEVTDLDYDAEGNLTRAISARGSKAGAATNTYLSDFRYDALGRRVAEVRRGAATDTPRETGYAYDLRGNLIGLADPRHTKAGGSVPEQDVLNENYRRWSYRYDDADNRLEQVEDPGTDPGALKLSTKYAYDDNDNLVQETNPRQKTTRYTYDARDLVTDVSDPTNARTHYELRPNGQLESTTTPRGTETTDGGDFTTTYGYNANNELTSRSLPQAPGQYAGVDRSVVYTRDAVGNPQTITDARSNAFANTFLDSGELRTTGRPSWWIIDGGTVRERTLEEHASDAAGALPESEGHGDYGRVDGQSLPELLPRAGQTTLEYDNELRIVGVKDAADNSCTSNDDRATLGYDPLGRLTSLRQLRNRGTGACPDTGNDYVSQTYTYDFNGNLAQATDPRGNPTTNDYNGFDELRTETAPGNSSGANAVTELIYDDNGNVTDRITPRGNSYRWQMTFDAADRTTSVENPADQKTSYTLDANGNIDTKTTPRNHVWDYDYTDRDELAKLTAPDAGQASQSGRETTYGYDANGNQTQVSRPGADGGRIVTTREFDGRDLPWTQTVGNRTTVTEYDPNGNLRRTVNPAGVGNDDRPVRAWDGTKPTQTSTAAENATAYAYNADDLRTSIHLPFGDPDGTDPAPNDASRWRQDFSYDARGRIRTIDAPYLWRLGCDPDATPPSQGCTARTTYGHLDADWPSSQSEPAWTDPDSSATGSPSLTYSYNPAGEQTGWATASGSAQRRIVTRDYFPDGTLEKRTAKETGTDAAPQRSFTYAYNLNGSLTRMTDDRGPSGSDGTDRVTRITRDAAERQTLVNEMWANSKDTVLAYDPDGNVLNRRTDGAVSAAPEPAQPDPASYTGGKTTSFDYDALGRERHTWVCTTNPGAACAAANAQRTTSSLYYDGDFLRERTKPGGIVETRSFNDRGKLANLTRKKDASVQKNQSYTYDPNDNRTTDERGTHVLNARSQLVRWTRKGSGDTVNYTVNGAGAVTSRTDGPLTLSYCLTGDRVTSAWLGASCSAGPRAAKYSYDSFGFSDVEKIETFAGGLPQETTTYSYDAFGRMKTAEGPALGTGDDGTFVYDALDRRDAKTQNGQTLDHSYVGLTESLSREQRSDGKSSAYDYDSTLARLGQTTKTSGSPEDFRGYGTDANGSVEQLEKSDGTLAANESYTYDPYGHQETAEAAISPQAQGNPFRFQGFYYDGEISTYDMQARPYRPDIGRFLTQDRFEDATGDLNLQSDPLTNDRYTFVSGNPINNIEFDGHKSAGNHNNTDPGADSSGSVSKDKREEFADTQHDQGASRRTSLTTARRWERNNSGMFGTGDTAPTGTRVWSDAASGMGHAKQYAPPTHGQVLAAYAETAQMTPKEEAQAAVNDFKDAAVTLKNNLECKAGPQIGEQYKCPSDSEVAEAGGVAISFWRGGRGRGPAGMHDSPGAAKELRPSSSAVSGKLLKRQLASEAQIAEGGTPIFGPGTGRRLSEAPRLARTYGGRPDDWVKMGSSTYEDRVGRWGLFETHWYQNARTGQRFEPKTKFPRAADSPGGSGG